MQSEVRVRIPVEWDVRAPAPTMVRWMVCEYLPMPQIGSALPRRLVPGDPTKWMIREIICPINRRICV